MQNGNNFEKIQHKKGIFYSAQNNSIIVMKG